MDGQRVDLCPAHGLCHSFSPYPCSDKNKDLAVWMIGNKSFQEKPLIIHFDKHDGVRDIFCDRVIQRYLNAYGRAFNIGKGQFFDLFVNRRGEKQGLMLLSKPSLYIFDVCNETQVQHMICLIKDQGVDTLQFDMPLADQIKHAPRRRNKDIDAVLKPFNLRILFNTAI